MIKLGKLNQMVFTSLFKPSTLLINFNILVILNILNILMVADIKLVLLELNTMPINMSIILMITIVKSN